MKEGNRATLQGKTKKGLLHKGTGEVGGKKGVWGNRQITSRKDAFG